MSFRIVPMGGLANRLRAVLSWRSARGSIEVLWARSEGVCSARFLDVFEPLAGVTFTDIGDGPAQDYVGPCEVGPTCSLAPNAKPWWTEAYTELRPLPKLQAQIDRLAGTEPYCAIHVRRTDHTEHVKQFGRSATNEEFAAWVDAQAWVDAATVPLYVATDCADTLQWFCDRYLGERPVRFHVAPRRVAGYDQRAQSLADAVVDMYLCVRASAYRGSWMSSFSETIDCLRRGGKYPGGFVPHVHMPSADAERYRVKP